MPDFCAISFEPGRGTFRVFTAGDEDISCRVPWFCWKKLHNLCWPIAKLQQMWLVTYISNAPTAKSPKRSPRPFGVIGLQLTLMIIDNNLPLQNASHWVCRLGQSLTEGVSWHSGFWNMGYPNRVLDAPMFLVTQFYWFVNSWILVWIRVRKATIEAVVSCLVHTNCSSFSRSKAIDTGRLKSWKQKDTPKWSDLNHDLPGERLKLRRPLFLCRASHAVIPQVKTNGNVYLNNWA